ncbi:MAG: rRNA maturation RNase YbeY [Bacteroidota bacterium]|jgi:probable rRNA maturation factor
MIRFSTADVSYQLRDKTLVRNWLERIARGQKQRITSLDYIFCSDEYLYAMNVRFLAHRTYTDIITFDHRPASGPIEGECYISIERVRENARSLDVSVRDELHRVMVHGLLHLCGHGDKSPREQQRMRSLEDSSLAKRNF